MGRNGTVVVNSLPLDGQIPNVEGQKLRGGIFALDPGRSEQSGVVQDEVTDPDGFDQLKAGSRLGLKET